MSKRVTIILFDPFNGTEQEWDMIAASLAEDYEVEVEDIYLDEENF